MKFHNNKYLTTVAAAALALAVGACSSSSDDDEASLITKSVPTAGNGNGTDPETPAPLSELATAQKGAMDAADAAMTASGEAATAATDAMAAVANLATMQTGATAGGLAYEAHDRRRQGDDGLHGCQGGLRRCSGSGSCDGGSGSPGQGRSSHGKRCDVRKDGVTRKAPLLRLQPWQELMIVDTVKTVGGTDLDAGASNQVITTTTGEKTSVADTGFQDKLKEEETGGVSGRAYAAAVPEGTAEMTYRQAVVARDVTIGKTVDSDDDTARLAIITSYADSKPVKVFAYAEADPDVDSNALFRVSTTPGKIATALGTDNMAGGTGENADTTVTLRPLGMYYPVGDEVKHHGR